MAQPLILFPAAVSATTLTERALNFKVSNSRHERTRQDQRTPAQADSHNRKDCST